MNASFPLFGHSKRLGSRWPGPFAAERPRRLSGFPGNEATGHKHKEPRPVSVRQALRLRLHPGIFHLRVVAGLQLDRVLTLLDQTNKPEL